jgi:hypothetical protein
MQRVLAGVAQSAEQPSCKRQVSGSNPLTGSQVTPSPGRATDGFRAAPSASKTDGQ